MGIAQMHYNYKSTYKLEIMINIAHMANKYKSYTYSGTT